MAYVQGSLGEKISKTMDDAAALFKQGDKEKAFQYIDVAMEKSHGRCFERSDTAIKEAYLNAR